MSTIREHTVPILLTALCSFLGYLVLGIFTDILPVILPPLQSLPVVLYLRLILLLITLLALSVIVIIILALKSKPSMPALMSEKYCGIKFIGQINTSWLKQGEVVIDISSHCPKHNIILQISSSVIKGQNMPTLFCRACEKHYYLFENGAFIKPDEAIDIIRDRMLKKINLAALNPKR